MKAKSTSTVLHFLKKDPQFIVGCLLFMLCTAYLTEFFRHYEFKSTRFFFTEKAYATGKIEAIGNTTSFVNRDGKKLRLRKIYFVFPAGNHTYRSTSFSALQALKTNDPVQVEYVKNNPVYARIENSLNDVVNLPALFVLLVADLLLLQFLLFRTFRQRQNHKKHTSKPTRTAPFPTEKANPLASELL